MNLAQLPSEAQTRQHLIDHQLEQAGWSVAKGNLIEELQLTRTTSGTSESSTVAYRTVSDIDSF